MGNLRNRLLKILLVLLAGSAGTGRRPIRQVYSVSCHHRPHKTALPTVFLSHTPCHLPLRRSLFYRTVLWLSFLMPVRQYCTGNRRSGTDITENQNLRHHLWHPLSSGDPLLDWSGRSR